MQYEGSNGRQKPPVFLNGWTKLLLTILLIFLFAKFFVPWWNTLPFVATFARFVEANDMNPSAIYYTDVKETVDAEIHVQDALRTYRIRRDSNNAAQSADSQQ